MKAKLLFLLLFTSFSPFAQQYTVIPDANFEKKLIALGIDDVEDKQVLSSKINNLTFLEVSGSNIEDLTGIQDFLALQDLYCFNNKITSLDVSKNIYLRNLFCFTNLITSLDVSKNIYLEKLSIYNNKLIDLNVSNCNRLIQLWCDVNKLTNLDISGNIALENLSCAVNQLTSLDVSKNFYLNFLNCSDNQITSIDVSKNFSLEGLDCQINRLTSLDVSKNFYLNFLNCSDNQITSIDVSKNFSLKWLNCQTNQLTSLNFKNSNNHNTILIDAWGFSYTNFKNNPNLTCIQVDDENYSYANWATIKDDTAVYSTNCSILGTKSHDFNKIAIYPIPTDEVLHIDNLVIEEASIYNALGNLVKKVTFTSSPKNTLDLSAISSGVYHMNLKTKDGVVVKKIVIE
jgi:hypothetical protein